MKLKHGGKRAGAGRPKGMKWAKTLAKEAAREEARRLITAAIPSMIRPQIAHAQGIGHLFTRDKNGKFTRIEDEAQALKILTEGTEGEHYWIFMKDPSVQAFTDLMNRALDKPAEQVKVTGDDGGPVEHVFRWQT